MLDVGVRNWFGAWLTYNASSHCPASFVAERLKTLEEIWQTVGASFVGTTLLLPPCEPSHAC